MAGPRVLVADSDTETRAALGKCLSRIGAFPILARTGEEALQLIHDRHPAVVVLDIALPDLSGYEICHQLRAVHGPELPIIFLSAERTEPRDKVAGLLLGADDYVTKPFDLGELVSRIQRFAERAAATTSHPPQPEAEVQLTPSEKRILHLLAQGYGTKQIARQLSIAPKTVGTHISNVMRKLNVDSRTQAVVAAQRIGLVDVRTIEVEAHNRSAADTTRPLPAAAIEGGAHRHDPPSRAA